MKLVGTRPLLMPFVLTLLLSATLVTTITLAKSINVVIEPPVHIEGAMTGPLALDGQGKVYLAFYDRKIHPYDIFFTRSTDWGNTWEDYRQIGGFSNPHWAHYAWMTADDNDHVYVVWEDLRAGLHVYFTRSNDGGETFETEKRIDIHGYAGLPDIACDHEGHVYVSRHASDREIWIEISNDYGGNFDIHRRVDGGNRGIKSDISMDGSDKIYVVFADARISPNFYFTRSLDSGNTWSTPILLGDFGPGPRSWSACPRLAVADGILYMAWPHWVDGERQEICVSKSNDFGNTFSEPVVVTSIDIYSPPNLAACGGYVYVSWFDISLDGDYDTFVAVSMDRGETFSEPIQLDMNGADARGALLVAHDYSVYAVWSDQAVSPVKTYFSCAYVFIGVTIDINPETLNLKSKGKWVTCYIELPEGYDVEDLNMDTVLLEGTIPAESKPTEIGDYDKDGIPDLMIKFDRQALIEYLGETVGDVELKVTGEVEGTPFEGNDTIRVISKGKG